MGMEPFVGADANQFGPLVSSIPDMVDTMRQAIAFKVGLARQQAETQQAQAQAADAAQKLTRAQQFQTDLQGVSADPDAKAVSGLIMKYPEFAEQLKSGWDVKDKAAQTADLTQASEIYSAAASGHWDLALKQAQARLEADKAAGQADPSDQAMIDQIESAAGGDEKAKKSVLTMLGLHLASQAGPEHFATTYGALKGGYTLDAGAARYDDNGGMVAHSPFIKDADGNIRLWTDDGSGTSPPASGAPTSATPAQGGGFDNAVAHVLSHEGGYNPKDMNGAPVNFGINQKANAAELAKLGVANVKDLTQDQAVQIYRDKYWKGSGAENLPANLQAPYFDVYIRNEKVAQHALAQSGGDPAKFMQMSSAYFQNLAKGKGAPYAKAWADRDAENMAIATGQASPDVAAPAHADAVASTERFPIVIPGADPNQYHTLTPAEVKARGLDASQQYQLNTKTGAVTGLGKIDAGDQPIPGDPTKSGPEYLASLPPDQRAMGQQAKLLTEGRLGTISSFALAKPYWQKMLQMAVQYDPQFDMNMAPARKAAITAFTGTGKGAMLVGSINRVANHMDLLWNESKKLAGPETGFGPLNKVLAASGQAFEPADAKAYDTEVTFVAGELGKLAKAGVTTEGEVDKIINNLGRKNSSDTRKSAIQAAVGIIAGAVDPLKDQYNSAFTNDSTRPKIPWVTPKAQSIFSNIGGVDLSLTGEGAGSNAPASKGTIVRTGRDKSGRKVVQYSDGSIDYAD